MRNLPTTKAPQAGPLQPTPRGWRMRDFCEREAISRRTLWRWVAKGIVRLDRLGPGRSGIRVRYLD